MSHPTRVHEKKETSTQSIVNIPLVSLHAKEKLAQDIPVQFISFLLVAIIVSVLLFWMFKKEKETTLSEQIVRRKSNLKYIVVMIRIIIIFIFFNFVISNTIVASGSMEPTLMTNDFAIFNRLAYLFNDIEGAISLRSGPKNTKAVFQSA